MRQANDISGHQNLIKSFLYSFVPPAISYMDNVPAHVRFYSPHEEKIFADSRNNSLPKYQCNDSSIGGGGSYPKVPYHKKARSSFNRMQLYELEKIFMESKYLTISERIEIANKVKMTDMQVKTWFQNRRTKWR